MKRNKAVQYRTTISAFSTDQRLLLRARALDPFCERDTRPFTATGKPGDKYVYISYRPDRRTKVGLGTPADVLTVLDELDSPIALPTAQKVPPSQPSPLPSHTDRSWRLPLGVFAFAAFAAFLISPFRRADERAANARSNPLADAARQGGTKVYLPRRPSVETGVQVISRVSASEPLVGVATPRSRTRQITFDPAANSNQSASNSDKLVTVFAAIAAACDPTQSATSNAAPTRARPITQHLAQAGAILASQPSEYPVLPRAGKNAQGLLWPDSALVRNVETNLRAVDLQGGVLVLWAKDAAKLAQSVAANGSVITAIAGWQNGPWEYTVKNDRIEIREVAR